MKHSLKQWDEGLYDATRRSKKAWITDARAFNFGEPHPCKVCLVGFEICHAHHVVPLGAQYDRGFVEPSHEIEWLCPNHHAIVHVLLRSSSTATRNDFKRVIECFYLLAAHTPAKQEIDCLIDIATRGRA